MTLSPVPIEEQADDDRRAIVAILSGQEVTEIWQELWERHGRACHRIALKILGDENEAWSAVNDAWCKAYEGLDSEINSFAAWIAVLTRNQALDVLRVRRRRLARETKLEPWHYSAMANSLDPLKRTAAREALLAITQCDKLSQDERRAFILRTLDDKSYEEIAEITNRPAGTVASDIHRAKSKLRGLESIKRLLLPMTIFIGWLLGCGGAL